MHGMLIVIAAMLSFSGTCWSQEAPDAGATPTIVCDQPVYDFGSMDNRKNITHAFVLKNEGSSLLIVTNVHACCGASVRLAQKTIAPGKNTTLVISISLLGRKGRMNKSIYVHSNDRLNPIFQLRIIGTCLAMTPSNAVIKPEDIHAQEHPADGGSSKMAARVRPRSGK